MKLLRLNVGAARTFEYRGDDVATGIYKSSVEGARFFGRESVEGDTVVDLTVHGGTHKAAYLYPAEHYDLWRDELSHLELPYGFFGENLTTLGVNEESLCIGDHLTIGEAEFIVSEPRFPCFKLGARVGTQSFLKRFLESGRTGVYLFVARAGNVRAGDAITITARDPRAVPVSEFVRVYAHAKSAHHDAHDIAIIERLLQTEILDAPWRARFTQRLAGLQGAG